LDINAISPLNVTLHDLVGIYKWPGINTT